MNWLGVGCGAAPVALEVKDLIKFETICFLM